MNLELIDNIWNIKLTYDCLINDGKNIIKFIYNKYAYITNRKFRHRK